MHLSKQWRPALCAGALLITIAGAAGGQPTGSIRGQVIMKETGGPLHGANVMIVESGQGAFSGDDGSYEIKDVAPGTYNVIAHLDSVFTEAAQIVTVAGGRSATADFTLELTAQHYEITVTSSDKQQTAFESFQSVESLTSYDLTESADVSLGETLNHKVGTGVAKRSFGPGTSRPIIRGFDGDRVLIMEDGVRTGTLSSQSGDHGELINPAQLERLEIVKGPATLLYSGNAMGGTVNAVSRHHEIHQHPHQGMRGFVSGSAGSGNALGGASTGFEYGHGKWMIWGQGGGIRSGDYNSPRGAVFNSRSRTANGSGGLGWYGERTFLSGEIKYDDGSYGVPFATAFHGEEEEDEAEEEIERVALASRRQNYRFNWGLNDLGRAIDNFVLKLNYTDWEHDEVEFFEGGEQEIGTAFSNDQFVYRGVFEQRKAGVLSGRFGFWGLSRAYTVTGEEALSPPVDQTGFAVFGLEELEYERVKFQFGGRVEKQSYTPGFAQRATAGGSIADAIDRSFTGVSASAGLHADTWKGGAFVVNYAHSYRAPALEELYNFGPHLGNLAFEIGDPSLGPETGEGVEVSLRHQHGRVKGEFNVFYYDFSDFVFPFATGEARGGLQVIEFTQRDARFAGGEALLDIGLHTNLRINLGADFVDAQDTNLGTPLPRIPPLRGKVGFELSGAGFRLAPQWIVASRQHQTFTAETETPGYAVVDLKASYTLARTHAAHQFAVNLFNVGDRLYRNHASFIKDLAPEIGRGVRFTYMVRFF
jgi:iron complex outermembrane receptor protein